MQIKVRNEIEFAFFICIYGEKVVILQAVIIMSYYAHLRTIYIIAIDGADSLRGYVGGIGDPRDGKSGGSRNG